MCQMARKPARGQSQHHKRRQRAQCEVHDLPSATAITNLIASFNLFFFISLDIYS